MTGRVAGLSPLVMAVRMVEVLEKMDTPASRQLLATLRDGAGPQFSEVAREALARMK